MKLKKKKKRFCVVEVFIQWFSVLPSLVYFLENKLWVWLKTDLLILKVKLGVGFLSCQLQEQRLNRDEKHHSHAHWCLPPSQTMGRRRVTNHREVGKVSSLLLKKSTACSHVEGSGGVEVFWKAFCPQGIPCMEGQRPESMS